MERKNIELFYKLRQKSMLGYRRIKRLERKERRLYTRKSDLNYNQIRLALAYKAISKRSHISSIRWIKRHYQEYSSWLPTRTKLLIIKVKAKYARQELICQGFVPLSEFRMKTKSGKYAYIMSNSLLPGETLIYPEHFAHHCDAHFKKGCRWVHEVLSEIGLEGYTRIYYTAYKNGIAK